MKVIDPNVAANAYLNLSNINGTAEDTDDDGSTGSAAGGSFAQFLKDEARQAVGTLRGSEEMSAKAVTGEADITDVVQAVTAAEVTLQTVVATRDRMVSAYQEIMRMPI